MTAVEITMQNAAGNIIDGLLIKKTGLRFAALFLKIDHFYQPVSSRQVIYVIKTVLT